MSMFVITIYSLAANVLYCLNQHLRIINPSIATNNEITRQKKSALNIAHMKSP